MPEKYYGYGLPIDISTTGWQVDRMINVLHVFMVLIFIGWFIFFVYMLLRFRQRPNHKAVSEDKHFKLPSYLEIGIFAFELFLLFAYALPAWASLKRDLPPSGQSLPIRIVAEQFAWNIQYAGKDGVFGRTDSKLMGVSNPIGLDTEDPAAKDDLVTLNQLHIPVETPVLAHLSSKDVIHSFALPVMRVKQDAIPGQSIPIWFQAKKTGDFEIACAQLCGLGHYRMKGFFIVQSKADFDKWFEEQLAQR